MKPLGVLASAVASAIVPVLAAAGGALLLGACASCQSTSREASLPALATGSFDGIEADQRAHRLYLADGANHAVEVVDISSTRPQLLGTIDVTAAPKGLALAPDAHRLYAGVDNGALAVIDTDTGRVIKSISIGSPSADLVDYSPQKQLVFVGTGYAGEIVVVDAGTIEVQRRMYWNGPIEQPRYNPADGMVYATSPTTYSILRFDPADGKLTRTYKLNGCKATGLAINPSRQLAMTACDGSVAVVNLRSGAYDISRVVSGGDLVTYDPAVDRFLVATPHDRLESTLGVFFGDGTFLGSVRMSPKAHQAVFDDAHGLVYTIGTVGLMSFSPSACEPPPEWLAFGGRSAFFIAPLLALAIFLIWYARRPPRVATAPTWEDLKKEDLAEERERMRQLEDAIYGPLVE